MSDQAKNKNQESVEEMKAILRHRIDESGTEKSRDHFMIAELIERRIGVGNLEIYLDQFKKHFRDSINRPKTEEKDKAKNTAETIKKAVAEPLPIKIKVLSRERDPIIPPKRRKK